MAETPCFGNSHESMCELQPHAAALQDSLVCTVAQERSTSALRSSMVGGLVSRTMASLLCQVVMTTSTLLDRQGSISHSSYPTGGFDTPARFPSSSHLQSEAPAHPQAPDLAMSASPTHSRRERKAAGDPCTLQAHGVMPQCSLSSVLQISQGYLRSWSPSIDTSNSQSFAHQKYGPLPGAVAMSCRPTMS